MKSAIKDSKTEKISRSLVIIGSGFDGYGEEWRKNFDGMEVDFEVLQNMSMR